MWNDKTLEQIVSGKNADGSSSLESFLKDYSRLTKVKLSSLQPGCNNCLQAYYKEYLIKHKSMSKECSYTLQKRYETIPLKIGGAIYLTNNNLTNEYAESLIGRYLDIYESKNEDFNPSLLFSEFPKDWANVHFEESNENLTEEQEEALIEAEIKKEEELKSKKSNSKSKK